MRRRGFILILLGALLGGACDSSVFYNENHSVDAEGWNLAERLTYNIEAEDTTETYLCCIDIRNRNDYAYQNLYLNIVTIYPDGGRAADTNMEFRLAQPDGQWLGKSRGRYVDGRYPLCYLHFPQRGQYQFQVTHAMRDTLLKGIDAIGIHLQRMGDKE